MADTEQNPIPAMVDKEGSGKSHRIRYAILGVVAALSVGYMVYAAFPGNTLYFLTVSEFMAGQEISVFAFVDGERVSSMISACDYKPVCDGNIGPNTGGMGSYSPPVAAVWNADMESRIRREIMEPVVAALASKGSPFRGILYAGLMLTVDGPKVVEFNCRLGDPEAQVVLPRLKSDLLGVLICVALGDLSAVSLEWDDQSHVAVVLASEGYPGKYATGFPIDGLTEMPPGVTPCLKDCPRLNHARDIPLC